jgi:hypothetical protein
VSRWRGRHGGRRWSPPWRAGRLASGRAFATCWSPRRNLHCQRNRPAADSHADRANCGARPDARPPPTHNGPAYGIKVLTQPDGALTVTNACNGFAKIYGAAGRSTNYVARAHSSVETENSPRGVRAGHRPGLPAPVQVRWPMAWSVRIVLHVGPALHVHVPICDRRLSPLEPLARPTDQRSRALNLGRTFQLLRITCAWHR